MTQELVPGMLVQHPQETDWGIGQVQSVIGQHDRTNDVMTKTRREKLRYTQIH